MQKLAEYEGGWTLYDLGPNKGGWTTLHLKRAGPKLPKRSWWLTHNGSRIAEGTDLKLLTQHNPHIPPQIRKTLNIPVD